MMNYKHLTDEQKSAALEQTLTQIEHEHYLNSLALKRAEAIGDDAQVKNFKDALADLEAQYKSLSN